MDLDNFNQLVGTGINIYGSRERIRQQLVDFAKTYLELETVDFYKTSVISYIIDTLSILSANHLFYDSMIYREFFMVEAQLQESVYNLARWIGYEIPKATPSTIDILFTIPLSFSSSYVNFTIPNNFKVSAGDISFTSNSPQDNIPAARFKFDKEKFKEMPSASGQIINNTALSVQDGNGYNRKIYLSEQQENNVQYASFTLSFTQYERQVKQFIIPETIQPYQFYSKKFTFDGMVSDIKVWIAEPQGDEKINIDDVDADNFNPLDPVDSYKQDGVGKPYEWTQWEESIDGIYTLSPNSKQYIFVGGVNQAEIFFGNGIIGKQPRKNSAICVELYITQGEDGHVIPHSITRSDSLYYTNQAMYDSNGNPINSDITSKLLKINFQTTNPIHSQGGENVPTLPEIKRNAIVNLRSKSKLVSELDYDDINTIMGSSFPTVEAYPILKRSDIKINEIMTFILLQYHDDSYIPQIVPTRNATMEFIDPPFDDEGKYTIMRTSEVTIDDEKYQTLFNITLNKNTRLGYYDYILQNVKGSPTIMYNEANPSWYQQYSYMPITGVDFDVEIEETAISSSSSSSSVYDSNHIYPLKIRANVNHIPQNTDEEDPEYNPNDYQIGEYRCKMITKWGSNYEYQQASYNIDEGKYYWFDFEIENYKDIPFETQRFEFHLEGRAIRRNFKGEIVDENGIVIDLDEIDITNDIDQFIVWQPLSKYYCDVIIRKDLSDVMISTISDPTNTWDGITYENSYKYYLYNVPVIFSNYLDDGDEGGVLNRLDNQNYPNFEVTVMQSLISNLNLEDKRMLTDFVNVKFPDTYGKLNNLKYNPSDYIVRSRYKTPFSWEDPDDIIWNSDIHNSSSSSASLSYSYKYIVNGIVPNYESAGKELAEYIDCIAEYYESSGWYLIKPKRGMYITVEDELDSSGDYKKLVYDGDKWKDAQSFNIPLKIDLKIEMDPMSTMSSDHLKYQIKEALMEHFSPYMGIQREIDRSEIVTVARQIPGVRFCEVKKPEVDIRFNYDIKNLTQKQLIEYTPQYVGMISDDTKYSSNVQNDGIEIEIEMVRN